MPRFYIPLTYTSSSSYQQGVQVPSCKKAAGTNSIDFNHPIVGSPIISHLNVRRSTLVSRFLILASFLLSLFCTSAGLHAQMEVTNGAPFTPESLIENVFLGDGVEVLSVDYEGDPRAVAFFSNAFNDIGMDRGIIMSTGITEEEGVDEGINDVGNSQASVNIQEVIANDPDVTAIVNNAGTPIFDITRYTITFRPTGDTLSFNYIFGSEEYPEFVCSNYNDIFGFFISGPGINGPYQNNAENIALIPGTNLPVRINYLNSGQVGSSGQIFNCIEPIGSLNYSQYYVDNNNSNNAPIYDGYTRVLTATVPVQPCQEYTIKLVIADINDSFFDSGVFLEAKSFGGGSTNLEIADLAIDGSLAEGCRSATLNFSTPNPVTDSTGLEVSFFGDATPGADYTTPPDTVIIPAGDSLVSFTLEAFEDFIDEADEFVYISLRRNPCTVDTFQIRIRPNILTESLLTDSISSCPGDTTLLNAEIPVVLPDPPNFSNTNLTNIGNLAGEYPSFITISGMQPEFLGPGVIKSVCIDSLEHQWIDDLDIYLIGPNGQILELTTDNGADGGNGFLNDGYFGTCFTPRSNDPITGPGNVAPASFVPFTGEWMPEGVWSDIYDGNYTTNGTWELLIIDDTQSGTGRLYEWSICFEPTYTIEYDWSGNPDGLSCLDCPDPTYSGIDDGYLRVLATDSYGCMVEDSVLVSFDQNPPMSQPVCEIATDSSVTVSWTEVPGALFYEVRIERDPWTDAGQTDNYTFNGLQFDSVYTFEVRAVFTACPTAPREVVCMTLPCTPPSISGIPQSPSCSGLSDGQITVAANGTRPPYSYFYQGVADADGVFDNLPAGEYTFSVVDNRGCADSSSFTLVDPAPISSAVIELAPVACNGDSTASLAAEANGGSGAYSFSWNGVVTTDSIISDLPAGIYVLDLMDANGCISSTTYEVTDPPLLEAQTTTALQNCAGPPNGIVTVTLNGGTPDYNYSWSDPNIGNVAQATGLTAGEYQLTATDQFDCPIVLDITVEREPDVALVVESQDILCFGETTGAIEVNVNVGQAPLDFDWTGPGAANGDNPENLAAGLYQVVVTDGRGCSATSAVEIFEPPLLISAGTVTDVACGGDTSGVIDISTQGGTLPYSFIWQDGMNMEDRNQLPAGDYSLQITDANGCSISQDFTVSERPAMEVDFLVEAVDCPGESNGGVFISLSNGDAPYQYNWSTGETGTNLTNVVAGSYGLEITDANGCVINTTAVIPEPPNLSAEAIVENIRCFGTRDGLIEIDLSGGSPSYQFRLNNGPWQSPNTFVGLERGIYSVEVRDQNDCRLNLDNIIIEEPAPISVSLGPDIRLQWGDSAWLTPIIDGGTYPISRYQWEPADTNLLSCLNCSGIWVKPNEQASIRLRVFDAGGCSADDVITLFVDKEFPVEVPTGFTPNGDNQNDLLIVHGRPDTEVLSFQVFDRWGEIVYERENFLVNDELEGWDGNFRGQPVNSGVFIWQATARTPDGREESIAGQTTLIR
ncbi:MAG: choice-of-anchor L domain-containing protein [Bacteroidota bacterium]